MRLFKVVFPIALALALASLSIGAHVGENESIGDGSSHRRPVASHVDTGEVENRGFVAISPPLSVWTCEDEIEQPEPDGTIIHEECGGVSQEASGEKNSPDAQRADDPTAQRDRQIELMIRVLQQEDRDPDWSTQSETVILETYNGPNLNSVDAVCRTSLCRIDIETRQVFQDASELEDLIDKIPWNGEVFFSIEVSEDHSRMVLTMFVGREGRTLPRLD